MKNIARFDEERDNARVEIALLTRDLFVRAFPADSLEPWEPCGNHGEPWGRTMGTDRTFPVSLGPVAISAFVLHTLRIRSPRVD
jgi:hypothetical protein